MEPCAQLPCPVSAGRISCLQPAPAPPGAQERVPRWSPAGKPGPAMPHGPTRQPGRRQRRHLLRYEFLVITVTTLSATFSQASQHASSAASTPASPKASTPVMGPSPALALQKMRCAASM